MPPLVFNRYEHISWEALFFTNHRHHDAKHPAVVICCQNERSSASCRASVTDIPVSRQIWWIQVMGGRPRARFQSGDGRAPSWASQQVRRIWFAGTSSVSLATWPNSPSLRLRTMEEAARRPVRHKTSLLDTKSYTPSDVKYPPLTPCVKGVQSFPICLYKSPGFWAIEENCQHACGVYTNFRWHGEIRLIPDTL